MGLSSYSFEQMLPPYLTNIEKGRIQSALEQFFEGKDHIDYSDFYWHPDHDFLMQTDLVHSVVSIDWNDQEHRYESGYNPAMLISNSCDVSLENDRSINSKDAMFAPLMSVENHLKELDEKGYKAAQIDNFYRTLIKQEYTNLFYLPRNPLNDKDYIVRLDKIHWVPQTAIVEVIKDLPNQRFISLSNWAYYLYITKISLHLSRIPEELERKQN